VLTRTTRYDCCLQNKHTHISSASLVRPTLSWCGNLESRPPTVSSGWLLAPHLSHPEPKRSWRGGLCGEDNPPMERQTRGTGDGDGDEEVLCLQLSGEGPRLCIRQTSRRHRGGQPRVRARVDRGRTRSFPGYEQVDPVVDAPVASSGFYHQAIEAASGQGKTPCRPMHYHILVE
jgi:hypothetical protein